MNMVRWRELTWAGGSCAAFRRTPVLVRWSEIVGIESMAAPAEFSAACHNYRS